MDAWRDAAHTLSRQTRSQEHRLGTYAVAKTGATGAIPDSLSTSNIPASSPSPASKHEDCTQTRPASSLSSALLNFNLSALRSSPPDPQTQSNNKDFAMVSTTHNIDPKSRDNRQAVTHRFTKQSKAKKHRFSGVVRVVPRKKTMGQEKIERNADCVEVTIHKIKALSHLSQTNAAKEL
eukprot:1150592-Rhodomonas_salina.1